MGVTPGRGDEKRQVFWYKKDVASTPTGPTTKKAKTKLQTASVILRNNQEGKMSDDAGGNRLRET